MPWQKAFSSRSTNGHQVSRSKYTFLEDLISNHLRCLCALFENKPSYETKREKILKLRKLTLTWLHNGFQEKTRTSFRTFYLQKPNILRQNIDRNLFSELSMWTLFARLQTSKQRSYSILKRIRFLNVFTRRGRKMHWTMFYRRLDA